MLACSIRLCWLPFNPWTSLQKAPCSRPFLMSHCGLCRCKRVQNVCKMCAKWAERRTWVVGKIAANNTGRHSTLMMADRENRITWVLENKKGDLVLTFCDSPILPNGTMRCPGKKENLAHPLSLFSRKSLSS